MGLSGCDSVGGERRIVAIECQVSAGASCPGKNIYDAQRKIFPKVLPACRNFPINHPGSVPACKLPPASHYVVRMGVCEQELL